MSKENMLVAIHRIQRTVNKQRQAIPPGAVFEASDDAEYEELTSGEFPAARKAKNSDIELAKESGLKIEIRAKRPMTLREIQARRAAQMQDSLIPPLASNAKVEQPKEDEEDGEGKEDEDAEETSTKAKKKKRDLT